MGGNSNNRSNTGFGNTSSNSLYGQSNLNNTNNNNNDKVLAGEIAQLKEQLELLKRRLYLEEYLRVPGGEKKFIVQRIKELYYSGGLQDYRWVEGRNGTTPQQLCSD